MNTKMKPVFDQEIVVMEDQFVNLVRKRLGIVIHTHQVYDLFKTIQEACQRFNCTPESYFQKLTESADQSELLDHLIKGITIGETYFFRDQQQMTLLQHDLLPKIIQRKRDANEKMIRIWSAGCSSGEEIYTIAMILNELLSEREQWSIKLLATDINTDSLNKAIHGLYTEWSMRSISDYYKNKYFKLSDKSYSLIDSIKQMVTFDYLNLKEDTYPSMFNGTNAQDLIICRNVLIYLDDENCVKLMSRMYQSLVEGGYLLLGASDPVHISGTKFVFQHQKGLLFSKSIMSDAAPENIDIMTTHIVVNEVKKNQPRLKKPFSIRQMKDEKLIAKKTLSVEQKSKESKFGECQLENAIDLANQGHLSEAITVCQTLIHMEPTNKLNYFTYGLILCELDQLVDAENAFKKSLFLDNQFAAAHFQLGILFIRNHQLMNGLKSLKNALNIAHIKKADESVPGCPGLNYDKLADILKNEIKLYES